MNPEHARTKKNRNPHTRDVNASQRVTLALEMRAKKHTYDEIAVKCGYSNASACRKAIMRELERCVAVGVEELRLEELHSLELLEAVCWKRLYEGGYETGRLFAVDRIIAIKDRRAKLMGLDAKSDDVLSAQVVVRGIPAGYLGEEEAKQSEQ